MWNGSFGLLPPLCAMCLCDNQCVVWKESWEGTHWMMAFCAPFNIGLVSTCSFTCFLCHLIVLFRTLPCKFIPFSSALASFPNVYFGSAFSFCRFCCWFAGLAGARLRRSRRRLRASMSMNSRLNRVSSAIRPSSNKGLVGRLAMQLSARTLLTMGVRT